MAAPLMVVPRTARRKNQRSANQRSTKQRTTKQRSAKLRIVFVSEYFHPRAAGGEVWSWELCTALAEHGYAVTVLTQRHDHTTKREERINGVRILRLTDTTPDASHRVRRSLALRRFILGAQEWIRLHREDIDIIHCMAYGVNVPISRMAEELGLRCVTSVHSFFGEHWEGLAGPLLARMERRTIRDDRSRALHVPSQYLARKIHAATGKRCVVIHNWLPDRLPKARMFAAPPLLFVGSLEPIKDPLACIPIAKRLDKPLMVIGDGTLGKRLDTLAAREGIAYVRVPRMSREEALRCIGGAAMLLVPSKEESFCMVALEAAAYGTPVAGREIGIIPELPSFVRITANRRELLSRCSQARDRNAFHRVRKAYARDGLMTRVLALYGSFRRPPARGL